MYRNIFQKIKNFGKCADEFSKKSKITKNVPSNFPKIKYTGKSMDKFSKILKKIQKIY